VILRALKQISKSSTANVPVNINKTQPNRFLFWPFFQQISRLQEPSTTYPSPTLTPSPTTRRQGLSAIGFLNLCRTRSRSHTQDLPGSVPQGPGAIPWPHGGFLSLLRQQTLDTFKSSIVTLNQFGNEKSYTIPSSYATNFLETMGIIRINKLTNGTAPSWESFHRPGYPMLLNSYTTAMKPND
jgi:hypothetical protein